MVPRIQGYTPDKRGVYEGHGAIGIGKHGAEGWLGTRGTNGITGVEHCGRVNPMGLKGRENILAWVHSWQQGDINLTKQ